MSRLATTLNTLTLVKQSSCYYVLVKTVATQIRSTFGFVGARHVKAHGEEHRRNIRWTVKCRPLSKVSYNRPIRITSAPPELLPIPCQVIRHLARPMPSFRLCNESDKCMLLSKRSLVSRCPLLVSDVSSIKYIGREGGNGMVYRRAAERTPLTRLPTRNPFRYGGGGSRLTQGFLTTPGYLFCLLSSHPISADLCPPPPTHKNRGGREAARCSS